MFCPPPPRRRPSEETAKAAGYNFWNELSRHAKGERRDALASLTLGILEEELHERSYEDMCAMVASLQRLLMLAAGRDAAKSVASKSKSGGPVPSPPPSLGPFAGSPQCSREGRG